MCFFNLSYLQYVGSKQSKENTALLRVILVHWCRSASCGLLGGSICRAERLREDRPPKASRGGARVAGSEPGPRGPVRARRTNRTFLPYAAEMSSWLFGVILRDVDVTGWKTVNYFVKMKGFPPQRQICKLRKSFATWPNGGCSFLFLLPATGVCPPLSRFLTLLFCKLRNLKIAVSRVVLKEWSET